MIVRALAFRRAKALYEVDLKNCSELNVFIGRNNAGKSSVLAGLDLAFAHLRGGKVAAEWRPAGRVADEFTARETEKPLEIGIEIEIGDERNAAIREYVRSEAPGLDRSIEEMAQHKTLSLIFSCAVTKRRPFIYLSELSMGRLTFSKSSLQTEGARLFALSYSAAHQLFELEREANNARAAAMEMEKAAENLPPLEYFSKDRDRDNYRIRSVLGRTGDSISPGTALLVEEAIRTSTTEAEFRDAIKRQKSDLDAQVESIEGRSISETMTAFAGPTKKPPAYIPWLMGELGKTKVLHFREARSPIGPEEASQLLKLKTKRGGTERLATIQGVIKSLLGVHVDAFEPEGGATTASRRLAEMDVDDFLVEANGAGIREALRIVLDIELKEPDLILIEEPEVHLHPGLERALHAYLSTKRDTAQMFIATHSTSFVDVSEGQSIFILSRDTNRHTSVEQVASTDDLLKIPEEVGLRPSTVFMFDKLVFVEGLSDELVLRAFARNLGLDLAAENVAFVHLGGASNFANFAADSTIGLLSRRRIPMWFLVDRDERDDDSLKKLTSKLGERAKLVPLDRRELENYLLDSSAVFSVLRSRAQKAPPPNAAEVEKQIDSAIQSLKRRVIELRVSSQLLTPIYPNKTTGSLAVRLATAATDVSARQAQLADVEKTVTSEVEERWSRDNRSLVPGSAVLEAVFSHYKLKYSKINDGPRVASEIDGSRIGSQLAELLREVAGGRDASKRRK